MISRKDLEALMQKPEGPAVSMYMPAHCVVDVEQDRIRFKNYLKEAENKLKYSGMRNSEAAIILEPGNKLLDDSIFWKCQGDGLAFFFGLDSFRYYRLPLSFRELVEVGQIFHIRPLLDLFMADGAYYVLMLSQKKTKLLHCTRYSCMDVSPEQMPKNIDEVLRYDQFEKQRQYHTVGSPSGGKSPIISHGQVKGRENEKVNLLRYFQEIDRALHNILKDEKAPLVLVAVDYLQPIYREANKYGNLIGRAISENADNLREDEILKLAWSIVEEQFIDARRDALKRYRELAGTGYSVDNLGDTVIAAVEGKVATLFVDLDLRRWGYVNREKREVKLLDAEKPGAEDLLDMATVGTLTRHGMVYRLGKGELPAVKQAAAILRY